MPMLEICENCKDFVSHDYSYVIEVFEGEFWLIKRCKPNGHISYKELKGNDLISESVMYQKDHKEFIKNY